MICNICPRRCGAERTDEGGAGACHMPAGLVLARAALHHWEEPCISGTRGAGTVFFTGCNLGCVFCQNGKISHENFGKAISSARLREIFEELIAQGAHNIDLVSPTHFTPWILPALEEPLGVPVVWNSGGYENVETLRALKESQRSCCPSRGGWSHLETQAHPRESCLSSKRTLFPQPLQISLIPLH